MGWWSYNHNMMGDSPANIMGHMLATLVERTKVENIPKPTLQELLVTLKLVINQNAEELLLEGGILQIKKIVAYLEDKQYVVSEELNSSLIQTLAPIIYENFVECQNIYQETFERKPKLSEFLWAVVFELSNPEEYLSIEAGSSIFDIVAELEQGTIVSFLQPTEVTPTTEAVTEASAPPLEPEITFSWTEIGNNNIISPEAINLLNAAFMALAQTYEKERGEYPTVKELVDGLAAIFVQNLEEFCADGGEVIVEYLSISLDGEPYRESCFDFGVENADVEFVIKLKNVLRELVKLYQEEWQRFPKFTELFETIKLFLFQDSIYEYLSVKKGTVVKEVLLNSRKRLPFPWEDIGNNEAISYDASYVFEDGLKGVAQTYSEERGEFPTRQQLLDYITTVLRSYLGEICDNSQEVSVEKLVLVIEDKANIVSNGGGLSPEAPLVITCRDACASLSPIYKAQWNRQPRLPEILKTLHMIIDTGLHDFLSDAERKIYIAEILWE
ncbi:MAG TPA: hypothetical protein DEG17_01545 [Cyanobacteria bacterium UBA11149]|nr:hypothetical protein [Cyanobacteria bacterium UBA11367]HBE57885.1 hypothetical protein [Cyanobacteria bacterium UBA11366]HBK62500.1 hypothetical protein [Cyanobacteria bacterium UBA11166]HBR76488.1 hypothetical protein [Cyanobacteria bacterium UBA11159]HBS67648.1 hypothetical protein [Cyanobacteria bacterium UBA11153]HBW87593.1 hypothetical protein [Cyanobacteria bacterium UBA11149]HCA95113.1 hypothetical protein [Cyanobacteria bacterium UBA9226]